MAPRHIRSGYHLKNKNCLSIGQRDSEAIVDRMVNGSTQVGSGQYITHQIYIVLVNIILIFQ